MHVTVICNFNLIGATKQLKRSNLNISLGGYGDLFQRAGYPNVGDIPLLNRKIFNGFRVAAQEHPYIVSVRRLLTHYLTATLLTKNIVITAASPLQEVPINELGVVAGETFSDRGTTITTVILVIIHEDFNPFTLLADLALLRTYEEFVFKVTVRPIPLVSPTATITVGDRVFVTGWGRCDLTGKELCLPRSSRFFPGEKIDPMMRTVTFVMMLPNYYCEGYERHGTALRPGMLCLGTAREDNPVAPCMAVPGAPVVFKARLLGVQSWGFGCGYHNDLPLVYTDVRYHQPWLVHNIPKLRHLNQSNLKELFEATKAFTLSQWLSLTRGDIELLKFKKCTDKDISRSNIDIELAKLRGTVYDIRDFLYKTKYRKLKQDMLLDIKNSLMNTTANISNVTWSTMRGRPFLNKYRLENQEEDHTVSDGTNATESYGNVDGKGHSKYDDSDSDDYELGSDDVE
ncbi:unnamed protein product [Parnassius mnemosyne]|uniref:Peptidase S1 domain-containing protein n=1 Tax=Parnassius mnemosyne TaxID=213953 RepID=A0AAV1L2M9_9NEOP